MGRWYQNVNIGDVVYEDKKRANSRFWNEGKWNNFIKPLLPEKRGVFLEIGCNAGLFLKMAKDEGFNIVVGVDGNDRAFSQAEEFKRSVSGDYKLLHKQVGVDFDLKEVPLADVVLLANVHYHMKHLDFLELVDELEGRCAYCIVVSARTHNRSGKPRHYLPWVRNYFKGWEEVAVVGDPSGVEEFPDDPAPRQQMYGVCFKGNLEQISTDRLYKAAAAEARRRKEFKHRELLAALDEFFPLAISDAEFDFKGSLLYKYWKEVLPDASEAALIQRLQEKYKLARSVRDNGLLRPVTIKGKDKIEDGSHRMMIYRALGWDNILVRRF